MLVDGGTGIATEMKDGDVISEILKTGIHRTGKAYLTLGEETSYAYVLYVGLREFGHTEISYPKHPSRPLSAIEYYDGGGVACRLPGDEESVQTSLAGLLDLLCEIDSRRHSERMRVLAHNSLLLKGLVPSGKGLDSRYYHQCVKSANRALNLALKRRWAISDPRELENVFERLLAGVSLVDEKDPTKKRLDEEVNAVDRAHELLKVKTWKLIPRQLRYRPSLSEYPEY